VGPICEDTHDPNLLAELLISSSVLSSRYLITTAAVKASPAPTVSATETL